MAPVFWDTGKHSTARKPRYRVSALVRWAWLRDQGMCRVGRSGGSRSEAFQQWLLLEPGEVHSHVSLALFLSLSLSFKLLSLKELHSMFWRHTKYSMERLLWQKTESSYQQVERNWCPHAHSCGIDILEADPPALSNLQMLWTLSTPWQWPHGTSWTRTIWLICCQIHA